MLDDNGGFRLAFVSRTFWKGEKKERKEKVRSSITLPLAFGWGPLPLYTGHNVILLIHFDNDTILRQLLLHQNNLLNTLDDKVATRIQRTLGQFGELSFRLAGQYALLTSKHNRQATNGDLLSSHNGTATNVLNVNINVGRVSQVSQSAFVRCIRLIGGVRVCSFRNTDIDITVSDTRNGVS